MPVHNKDVVTVFERIADLLDIKGENQFRIRAYRNAARTVDSLTRNVASMVEKGEDLTQFSGIGKDLAGKIATIVKEGSLPMLADLEKEVPPALQELLKIEGLGPRGVATIHEKLGITDLDGLEKAARQGLIRDLEGFGEKTEEKIFAEIEGMKGQEERMMLSDAEEMAEAVVEHLEKLDGVKKVCAAGSLRRRKETVGDVDILVSAKREPMSWGISPHSRISPR